MEFFYIKSSIHSSFNIRVYVTFIVQEEEVDFIYMP
jgi:hypothetical protein